MGIEEIAEEEVIGEIEMTARGMLGPVLRKLRSRRNCCGDRKQRLAESVAMFREVVELRMRTLTRLWIKTLGCGPAQSLQAVWQENRLTSS
ncbi:hypothetical protein OESDEN_19679 [Oesophagostomum dentatum]|uniref:Uncharacterized protein n=1 Tax=Oesophagostomum dentatum TaxID=61180 RepID=A0A0B1S5Q1_OESDE|nr:hypothetical protein OESDEN_19679 [Oesophagostomum dentatum]